MEFPNKPWEEQLSLPTPPWATHRIDYTNGNPESYSLWIGLGCFQYFNSTSAGVVNAELEVDDEGWTVEKWAKELLKTCPYIKITDLQPIEENE